MALRAAFTCIDRLAGNWIAAGFLLSPGCSQPADIGHQPPNLGFAQARAGHLRPGNAPTNGFVDLAVRAAVTKLARGQVHAAPTLALLSMTMGAMAEKILLAPVRVVNRVEGVLFGDVLFCLAPFLRSHAEEEK